MGRLEHFRSKIEASHEKKNTMHSMLMKASSSVGSNKCAGASMMGRSSATGRLYVSNRSRCAVAMPQRVTYKHTGESVNASNAKSFESAICFPVVTGAVYEP